MRDSMWMACAALLALTGVAEARERDEQGDFNISLGGGVGGFTGDLGTITDAGPTWGLIVNVQPWNILGYEISYEGARNQIDDERLAEKPALTRHGLAGTLKVAPPFLEKVRPFVGVGLGASMLRVTSGAEGFYRNDLMEEIPLTAGIEFNTGAVTAGLRTRYKMLFDEGFAGKREGNYLDGAVTLGARF
jgi:hypothetical protein